MAERAVTSAWEFEQARDVERWLTRFSGSVRQVIGESFWTRTTDNSGLGLRNLTPPPPYADDEDDLYYAALDRASVS